MNDKTEVFDKLQSILCQLKSDLEQKGLKLENLPEAEVARLIQDYVPDELMISSIQVLAQNPAYSLEPLWVALPTTQDHAELLTELQINPDTDEKGAIIKTLPFIAYYLGRLFCYGKSDLLKDQFTANDLNLTAMLSDPLFNLQGIYRLEQLLSELHSGNYEVSLNGSYGAICAVNDNPHEPDPISFTAEVGVRLNNLIDGHRVFIKFIAVSSAYQYEILDGEYVFYNETSSSNSDLQLSITGISELNFVVVEENTQIGTLDVLTIEQFTMTGALGQTNEEMSLRTPERQAKIAQTFIKQVEAVIIEQHTQNALSILIEYAKNTSKMKTTDQGKPKPSAATPPMFFDLDTASSLPS